jgi:predicted nucleic acid-binding protein
VKLAADANVLLSAVLGGRARLALSHPEVDEVLTTEVTFAEVQEYASLLGRKKRIAPETLMLAVAALPVSIVAREIYENAIGKARKRIGWRDPDDVELLALAMHFKVPLWSNDNDFEGCGVERYTTAEILHKLEIRGTKRAILVIA